MLDAKLLPSTVGSVFSTAYRRSVLLATVLVLALLVPQQAYCEQETPTSCLKKFHSRNFELLTDLDATDARQRLQLMEKVLSLASNYWGHRLHHPIECYLVHDLTRWTDHQFPSPVARRVLEHLGGGTDLKPPRLNSRDSLSSIIYATSKAGIVEHEVVHAYCFQVFGHGGPDWYREGMAEVFAQQITGKTTRATQRESLRLLRLSPRVSAEQIVAESLFADKLRDSVHRDNAVADPSAALTTTTSTDLANETAAWHWTAADAQHLQQAQLAYTKSWALCQLLHQNDRYRERFRVLGKQWLAGSRASFEECFGAACPQIDFELAQLIKNYDHGYRADLTSWSWSASARPLAVGESTTVRISAHRGYQPTRINMKVDEEYQIVADGTWRLSSEASLLDASGDSSGRGQLEAVVYRNYQLSTPDPLPVGVNWSSPQEGQLFLRCHDAWHKLSDNRGSMSVRVVRIR